jgi:hypothetical protein
MAALAEGWGELVVVGEVPVGDEVKLVQVLLLLLVPVEFAVTVGGATEVVVVVELEA